MIVETNWKPPEATATSQNVFLVNSFFTVHPPSSSISSLKYSFLYSSSDTLSGLIPRSCGVFLINTRPATARITIKITGNTTAFVTPIFATSIVISGTKNPVDILCPIVVYPITIPFFLGNHCATKAPPEMYPALIHPIVQIHKAMAYCARLFACPIPKYPMPPKIRQIKLVTRGPIFLLTAPITKKKMTPTIAATVPIFNTLPAGMPSFSATAGATIFELSFTIPA